MSHGSVCICSVLEQHQVCSGLPALGGAKEAQVDCYCSLLSRSQRQSVRFCPRQGCADPPGDAQAELCPVWRWMASGGQCGPRKARPCSVPVAALRKHCFLALYLFSFFKNHMHSKKVKICQLKLRSRARGEMGSGGGGGGGGWLDLLTTLRHEPGGIDYYHSSF